MTTEYTDDYMHPRADMIHELLSLQARIADARKLAMAQHNAAKADRIEAAKAGVWSSRAIDSRASGVALDMYVALS